jgi:hypothetical protein
MLPPDIPVSHGLSSDVCVIRAADASGVPADLMFAVRSVERGMPAQAVRNTDGTEDHNEPGLNTKTLIELTYRYGWDMSRLKTDGCYAMYAGSFWMRQKLFGVRYRGISLLSKAARYNSATPGPNLEYQKRLVPHMVNWACYLHVFWRVDAEGLFAVASGVLKPEDLEQCKKN